MRDSRILDYIASTPWALEPGVYQRLMLVVQRHADGVVVPDAEIAAIVAARDERAATPRSGYQNIHGVGVVPITGVIARHARQVNGSSQPRGTSIEQVRGDMAAALADKGAHSIMLAIDSPGGSVDGIVEVADEIRAARDVKPITAHVAGMGASAAYWLAAQATEIYATKGSRVGSIGVIAAVVDDHRKLEADGLDIKLITSAPAKAAGGPGRASTPEDLAEVRTEVQAWHELFVDAVAAGRGLDRAGAAALADGRVHFAPAAVANGMIDGVASEGSVLSMLSLRHEATKVAAAFAAPKASKDDYMSKQDNAGAVPAAEKPQAAAAVAPAPVTITIPDPDASARGALAERERILAIQNMGAGTDPAIIAAAIADGITVEQSAVRFVAWHKENQRATLNAMRRDLDAGTRSVGTDDPSRRTVAAAPQLEGEAKWRAEFQADAAIKSEFISEDRYVAFMKYDGRPARKEN